MEKDEREALEAIRDNPELLDGRKKRATVLLMADIGPDGSPVSRKQIHETTGLDLRTIGTIVEQAMDRVPIEVVMGVSREGQGRGQRRKRKLSPEEEQIAADFSTGKFTKVLLAERYGVSQSKVFFVIKEQEGFSR